MIGSQYQQRSVALNAAAILLCCLGGLRAEEKPDQGSANASAPPAASAAAASAPDTDRYQIPEGNDVAALLKFVEELKSFRPTSRGEYSEYRLKGKTALKQAAEKILELDPDPKSAAHQAASEILLQSAAQTIGSSPRAEQMATIQRLTQHFAAKTKHQREDYQLAMSVASALERSNSTDMAPQAYRSFGEIFTTSTDAQAARTGQMLVGAARRLTLVGNAMELKGTRLDGSGFDLGSLRGKVVLIDFWATWCPPCRAELPNIKENYERYRDQGFEVVGVSIDQDRDALEKYVRDQQVPWITLHEKETGGPHPATIYYGIFGIPTMFLIDEQGKVISLRARGKELTRLLEERFKESAAEPVAGD